MFWLLSFTIVLRKQSVKQSSEGLWMKERSCEPAGANCGLLVFISKIMPEDLTRIGASASKSVQST